MLSPTRWLAAIVAAGILSATFTAQVSAAPRTSVSGVLANCQRTFTLPMFDRAARTAYHGTRTPPRGSYAVLWRLARCQRPPSSEARARAAWSRYLAAWHLRRHPPQPQAYAASGDYGDVPGVPYSFASCVAWRESTDGAGSPDIYGILPMNGYYPGMSVPAQKTLFSAMYARDGVQPWAPYDGC